MLDKKISVFLPTRAGSERIKNKNTRNFAGIEGGLLSIKIEQLLAVAGIDEIVLSTNDVNSIEIANKYSSEKKLKIVKRPEELAQSDTNLIDLVKYAPTICSYNHILWTHVTSPLVKSTDYQEAIEKYFVKLQNDYDSLMSVKCIQNFIWSYQENKVINKKPNDSKKWPRTQDLELVYEVNSAIFVASKEIYLKENDRIGTQPFLLKHSDLQSVDVDWEEDFTIAELLYEKFK